MKRPVSFKKHLKLWSVTLLSLVIVMSFSSVSSAQWHYGIGTGIFGLNIDGDIGLGSSLGPIIADVDLDASDTRDLMESAFGFGGYATDGAWMIMYSLGKLELEDTSKTALPGGGSAKMRANLEVTSAELTVGYAAYESPALKLFLDGGLRYTKHDYNFRLSGDFYQNTDIDNDWTDFVIGATLQVPIVKNWSWNTRANAAFGGSEGTYLFNTGVAWRFTKSWSTTLYGKYTAVEYENGSKGDSDWYSYDADEFGLGIAFAYNW